MTARRTTTAQRYLVIALLCCTTLVAYQPVFHNQFVNFDDPGYVTANAHIRQGLTAETMRWAFTSTVKSNWHPLTWLSHALDVTLFGLDPAYHHAMNVLIHLLSSVLLFVLFERMTSDLWKSAFVAAVFALHPLHVESVAWVAERKDVLGGLFWILTILAYIRYKQSSTVPRYLLVAGVFALGLMAKPMLVTLPFVFLLVDYWPLRQQPASGDPSGSYDRFRRVFSWPNLREKIPFFLLAGISGVITYRVQTEAGSTSLSAILPFPVRVANAVVAYADYLYKTFIPVPISVFYPHPGTAIPAWQILLSGVILASVTVLAWKGHRSRPYLLFGWLWFLGTLVPVIGLIQVGWQAMADRYTYIPMIGIAVMAAWGVPELAGTINLSENIRRGITAGVVVLMILSTRTVTGYWSNSFTLFEHALSVTKNNDVAETNLGMAFADAGRHAEAVVHLREAYRLRPDEPVIRSNLARSLALTGERKEALQHYFWLRDHLPPDPRLYTRIADLFADEDRTEDAIAEYLKVLKLDSTDNIVRYKLGILYLRGGNTGAAQLQCEQMLRIRPENSAAHDLLGMIASQMGRQDDALQEFNEAVRIYPANSDALLHLGMQYVRAGRQDDAIQSFERAVVSDSGNWNARLLYGTSLARMNRLPEAAAQWESALRINPSAVDAHTNLGRLALMNGNNDEAIRHYTAALAIDSTNIPALYNYGTLLARTGNTAGAESRFAEILRLDPSFEPARTALRNLKLPNP